MKCCQCKIEFEGRKDAKYCSSACRQEAYRERHSIERPAFLPSKQPQKATQKAKGLGNPSFPPPKRKNPLERPFRPEWIKLKAEYDSTQAKRERLYQQRVALIERYNRAITEKSSKGKIIGGLGGAAIGRSLGETQEEKFWAMLLMGGLSAYFGHMYDQNQDADLQKKAAHLSKIEQEIKAIDSQLLGTDLYLANLNSRLQVEPKYEVIEVKPMEMERLPLSAPLDTAKAMQGEEPTKRPAPEMASTVELAAKRFKTWPFTGEWQTLLGEPEHGFHVVIHGKPGQGKSTFALKLAKYLADNFGRTLYVSSEEGHSKTMSDKAKTAQSPHLIVSEFGGVNHVIEQGNFPFIILDSANNMKLTPSEIEQIRKTLKERGQSLITIHQATKNGELRGSQEVEHNADTVIQVDSGGITTTKNRFGPLAEMPNVLHSPSTPLEARTIF